MNNLSYSNLLDRWSQLDRFLLKKEGEYQAFHNQKTNLEAELEKNGHLLNLYTQVQVVVEKLTHLVRQNTLDKVAAIVTKALQDVKDPSLSFKIQYKVERNLPVVEFKVIDKQGHEMDIIHSCGGTLADIIEFPLKVSLLIKWQPKLGKLLVLDETFKFVSAIDRPKMAQFVKQLSEKLGIQIILVTHSSEFSEQAHKVFSINHDGTDSKVGDIRKATYVSEE